MSPRTAVLRPGVFGTRLAVLTLGELAPAFGATPTSVIVTTIQVCGAMRASTVDSTCVPVAGLSNSGLANLDQGTCMEWRILQ